MFNQEVSHDSVPVSSFIKSRYRILREKIYKLFIANKIRCDISQINYDNQKIVFTVNDAKKAIQVLKDAGAKSRKHVAGHLVYDLDGIEVGASQAQRVSVC